ncbi:MAG: hypothetical protein ACJ72R_11955 [Nitrososphaeraceae archaeon]
MTFKDLKKKVSLEIIQQQFKLLDVYKDKPFWIWNIEEHKQEDIKTNGDCCFNYIIGLPQKNGNDKPLYNYEGIIYDSLVTHDGSTSSYGKYLDKKSNWLRNIRIHAQVHGLALLERQCIIRLANVHCYRAKDRSGYCSN